MLETFRTALLITLCLLVLIILYKRFKRYWYKHQMPVPRHLELQTLEVAYHPAMLRVALSVPAEVELYPALLAANHERLHAWPAQRLGPGEHVLELTLESGLAGTYVFEVATNTQRTERRFMVRPA